MMIRWFTVNALPLASTDTQNLTHALHLSILRPIYCTARNGHSKVSFQGSTVNTITLRLKYTFFTFFSTITLAKGQTHFYPLSSYLLSLSLSYWPSFFAAVCEKRGKRKEGTAHGHFLQLPIPCRNWPQSPVRKTDLTMFCEWWDVMYCTRIFAWEYLYPYQIAAISNNTIINICWLI